MGNRSFGVSGALRGLCAAIAPGNVEFFRYNWKATTRWNIALGVGVLIGGALVAHTVGVATPDIAPSARATLTSLGLDAPHGLVPAQLFAWSSLLTVRGAVCMIGGGFLVGFGASYGGGCTSGHGVTGLATLQPASVIAIISIFAGGLFTTFVLLPLVLRV
jgi:uncharacterized membrane protein YedE/YeeE